MEEWEKPHLVLLDNVPDSYLGEDQIASALQSFETCLYLLAANRWPSVILILWESCEKLLSLAYQNEVGTRAKELTSQQLQIEYEGFAKISNGLNDRSHMLRKKRNQIAHKGYMPKDTNDCIDLFFNAGFPYFNNILIHLFEQGVYELSTYDWFWSIYSDTRKIVTRRLNKGEDIGNSLFFFRRASRKVWSIGHASQDLSLVTEDQSILEEVLQNESADIKLAIRNRYINQLEKLENGYSVELSDYMCPICRGSEILAGVNYGEESGEYFVESLYAFACLDCNYGVKDDLLVKTFCYDKLSDQEIARISQDAAIANTVPVGFDSPWEDYDDFV